MLTVKRSIIYYYRHNYSKTSSNTSLSSLKNLNINLEATIKKSPKGICVRGNPILLGHMHKNTVLKADRCSLLSHTNLYILKLQGPNTNHYTAAISKN